MPHSDKEADVNARNVNGCTPLHIAVMIQNINLIKLLIKFGADINLKVVVMLDRSTMTLVKKQLCTTVWRRTTSKLQTYCWTKGQTPLWEIRGVLMLCTMRLALASRIL